MLSPGHGASRVQLRDVCQNLVKELPLVLPLSRENCAGSDSSVIPFSLTIPGTGKDPKEKKKTEGPSENSEAARFLPLSV